MTVTGLFFLPLPPNATPSSSSSSSSSSSITPTLASHISRKYLTTSAPLPPYQVFHHLLVDTSSLLPNHPVSTHPRRYTQFLTLSHHQPGKTYVGTSSSSSTTTTTSSAASSEPTAPAPATSAPPTNLPAPAPAPAATSAPPKMTIVAVPTGPPAEELFWTVTRKMEPLWAFRSTLRIDHGVAFSLLGDGWRLRLGDVRIAAGPGQGRVRGMLAELEFRGLLVNGTGAAGGGVGGGGATMEAEDAAGESEDTAGGVDWEGAEKMLRSFWDGIIDGSGVGVGMMDRLQVVVRVPGVEAPGEAEADELTLVRQYMELLRFARA